MNHLWIPKPRLILSPSHLFKDSATTTIRLDLRFEVRGGGWIWTVCLMPQDAAKDDREQSKFPEISMSEKNLKRRHYVRSHHLFFKTIIVFPKCMY
jgi:hypothetical protein